MTTHAGTAGKGGIRLHRPGPAAPRAAPGSADELFTPQYEQSYRYAVEAVTDIRQTIDAAATQRDLQTSDGVAVAGFSMGTWFGSLAAAVDVFAP